MLDVQRPGDPQTPSKAKIQMTILNNFLLYTIWNAFCFEELPEALIRNRLHSMKETRCCRDQSAFDTFMNQSGQLMKWTNQSVFYFSFD